LSRDWSKINLAIKVLYLLLLNFYIELWKSCKEVFEHTTDQI
jgi:hypothetical protein